MLYDEALVVMILINA